ncbi:hypothetical protein HHX47_DHR5000566 [Lentinula edodes]|nr:hypothetical protein HHX47_DHR5000566 [Lentinula edodes]
MPQNGPIVIQPNASALVIIDMQNFFLHESLNGDPKGRAIVPTTITLIHAFRNAGMPVLWTNWGMTDYDIINMPPAFIQGFSSDDTSLTSFGSEMGTVVVPQSDQSIAATSTTSGPNITIDAGRKLTRGSWNAQPAYYKGYDVIIVDDISATTSPSFATQMVDYNVALDGWRVNSTDILPALVDAHRT